ncbi:MFS transporter [Yersinia aldovae]|uniref:MFS transporter n=1 Tax=Yersinia aldovae TaxID=29483 RepID=UPI0005ABC023|nr:MFS transporter [Yersinia aldovae]AJJ62850.1 major Facilitator Superfamily protein [Yersinia aldovae 670-83]CNJ83357.1 Alpha-ketoglutarate permease [Yersinia aldovae]
MTTFSPPVTGQPSDISKVVFGMPIKLFWGYIAIAIFMTGDGIELAFLSKYIIDIGFDVSQSAMIFTAYAITAAIASWLSGGISEIYGPRKIMALGVVWWVVFHVLFIQFGLSAENYPLMLVFYALRGFAYPLFFYAFYVLVVQRTPSHRLASATGWIWSMFTIGYGIIASFLPSVTIPLIGFIATLWISLVWVIVGGAVALLTLKDIRSQNKTAIPMADKLLEISRGITLIFQDKDIFLALIIRILCNLALFGFPIFMPLHYTSQGVGFTSEQWMRIWGIFFLVQPVTNVLWGIIGDRIGWLFQMRWVGFFGCTVTTLLFYFMPLYFPANLGMAIFFALMLALTITSFVPMGAIFPMLAPDHKGAAISVQNLGGGIGNFIGPAIATILFTASFDIKTVVICYSALYFLGGILTWFIRNPQPEQIPTPIESHMAPLSLKDEK